MKAQYPNPMSIDVNQLKASYGILCQRLEPGSKATQPPYHPTYCEVAPGTETFRHQHFEFETFFIQGGSGTMYLGDKFFTVKAGDSVVIPSFTPHHLVADAQQTIRFLSVYSAVAASDPLPERTLIAAAPPTPNGALHVGHLSGPYLAADAESRYLTMRGVGCLFLSGTDDHQPYVAIQAEREKSTVSDLLTKYRTAILAGFHYAQIEPTQIFEPIADKSYQAFVQRFFEQMVRQGVFVLKKVPTAIHPLGGYHSEPEVAGKCPHCHAGVLGNGCENCGSVFPLHQVQGAVTAATNDSARFEPVPRYVFNLEAFREQLTHFHSSQSQPLPLQRFLRRALASPLPEIEVSGFSQVGIELPKSVSETGIPAQVINPWIEMAGSYLYALRDGDEFIPAFGFDNVFYYSLVFPALFFAAGRAEQAPLAFLTNEFFHLEGAKFSTSRGYAIWALQCAGKLDSDFLRFHLSLHRPENSNTNFSRRSCNTTVDSFFVPLDHFLGRLQASIHAYQHLPVAPGPVSENGKQIWIELAQTLRAMQTYYHPRTFSLVRSATELQSLAQSVLSRCDFLSSQEQLGVQLAAASVLAQSLLPICPRFATKLLEFLGRTPNWIAEPLVPTTPKFAEPVPRMNPQTLREQNETI
jgi:methionyl-tRNA synthetase